MTTTVAPVYFPCPHGESRGRCEPCNPGRVRCPGCGTYAAPEHMAADLGFDDPRCLTCLDNDPEGAEL